MMTWLASTCFFLVLHILIQPWIRNHPFHVRLKISRGVASLVLSLIGFYTLVCYFPLWKYAFILKHPPGQDLFLDSAVWILMGHFLADFIWLAYGISTEKSKPRADLVIHHVFGLVVCIWALYLEMGYAMIALAMTAELMPVTTGIHAWGQIFSNKTLESFSVKLRLFVLLGWRIPLWLFVFFRLAWELFSGASRAELKNIYPICFFTAAFLIVLDIYWSRACFKNMKSAPLETVSKKTE